MEKKSYIVQFYNLNKKGFILREYVLNFDSLELADKFAKDNTAPGEGFVLKSCD
jgi:hypothetical protein